MCGGGFYSHAIFPWLMNAVMSGSAMARRRGEALAEVTGQTLEIGFGTGLSLPHYPPSVTKLTAIDANEGMEKYARRRITHSSLIVDYQTINGEALPMPDGAFDSVVSAYTLCSIAEVEKALKEARRVLKPGGRFFFLEHGLGDDEKTRKWQRRLTPLQKIIGDGCHLDRDIETLVKDSGLRIVSMKKFLMDKSSFLPETVRKMGQMYMGVAVRQ